MVERQLCKLEVRGSNPLASSLRLERSEKQGCHAGAKRRRAVMQDTLHQRSKTTTWQASLLRPPLPPTPMASINDFCYVYILVSATDDGTHYTGITRNLRSRLGEHNRGKCPHTINQRPWKIETAIAFRSEQKARRFERYLKTGSGREFARRHF